MLQLFLKNVWHQSSKTFQFCKEPLEVSTDINLHFIAATSFWSRGNFPSAVPNTVLFTCTSLGTSPSSSVFANLLFVIPFVSAMLGFTCDIWIPIRLLLQTLKRYLNAKTLEKCLIQCIEIRGLQPRSLLYKLVLILHYKTKF